MSMVDAKAELLVNEGLQLYSQGFLDDAIGKWELALSYDENCALALQYIQYVEQNRDALERNFSNTDAPHDAQDVQEGENRVADSTEQGNFVSPESRFPDESDQEKDQGAPSPTKEITRDLLADLLNGPPPMEYSAMDEDSGSIDIAHEELAASEDATARINLGALQDRLGDLHAESSDAALSQSQQTVERRIPGASRSSDDALAEDTKSRFRRITQGSFLPDEDDAGSGLSALREFDELREENPSSEGKTHGSSSKENIRDDTLSRELAAFERVEHRTPTSLNPLAKAAKAKSRERIQVDEDAEREFSSKRLRRIDDEGEPDPPTLDLGRFEGIARAVPLIEEQQSPEASDSFESTSDFSELRKLDAEMSRLVGGNAGEVASSPAIVEEHPVAKVEQGIPVAQFPDTIEGKLKHARQCHIDGNYEMSLDLCQKVLHDDSSNEEAQIIVQSCQDILQNHYYAELKKLDQVPVVKIPQHEIMWHKLDHRAGFLLSRIDGMLTYEDILDICGMSRFEACRLLVQLLRENVIG